MPASTSRARPASPVPVPCPRPRLSAPPPRSPWLLGAGSAGGSRRATGLGSAANAAALPRPALYKRGGGASGSLLLSHWLRLAWRRHPPAALLGGCALRLLALPIGAGRRRSGTRDWRVDMNFSFFSPAIGWFVKRGGDGGGAQPSRQRRAAPIFSPQPEALRSLHGPGPGAPRWAPLRARPCPAISGQGRGLVPGTPDPEKTLLKSIRVTLK